MYFSARANSQLRRTILHRSSTLIYNVYARTRGYYELFILINIYVYFVPIILVLFFHLPIILKIIIGSGLPAIQ